MELKMQSITKALVEELSQQLGEPAWLLDKRLKAFAQFEKLAMPDFKYGITVKLNPEGLDLDKLKAADVLKIEKIKVEQVEGIIIKDLHSALKTHESLIKKHLFTKVPIKNKIDALHVALFNRALFILVPKGVAVKKDVLLPLVMEHDVAFEHILVIAEEGSEATIVEDIASGKETNDAMSYRSSVAEVFVKADARINYGSVQNLNREVFNFSFKTAVIEKDASLDWMDCCLGSKVSQVNVTSFIVGKNGNTKNWGTFLGDKKQQFDIHANTIHEIDHTESDMLTKGVMNDDAKVIYRGLIHIQQPAHSSNGYQRVDTVLLTNKAEADVIPMLEIDNSDVKCTHGSSVGRVDKKKVFYMMSRGMSEEAAKKEYIRGFFEQMFDKIKIPELVKKLRENIYKRLELEDTL